MERKINNLFNNLQLWWNKKGYKAYNKQNISIAGKDECYSVYLDAPLEGKEKEQLSNALLEMLLEAAEYEGCDESIVEYLVKFPLIEYYFTFVEKLKILVKEKILSKDTLFNLAMEYIKNSKDENLIKLGLTLLKYTENKNALEVLKIFTNHNDYIFYAIESIREYEKCNSIIFDVAKAANGYGKVIAVNNLELLSDEIKEWVIEKAADNEVLSNIIAAMKFDEYEYIEYFMNEDKTKDKYKTFTKNMRLLCELEDYLYGNISFDLVYIYFEYFKEFSVNFDNLYVILSLISLYHNKEDERSRVMREELSKDERLILEEITKEIFSNDYSNIVKAELNYNNYNNDEIIAIAILLNIKLSFNDFKRKLVNSIVDLPIYSYIIEGESYDDKKRLLNFAVLNLPFETIANGMENITEKEMGEKYIADACLYVLLNFMSGFEEEFDVLNIKGLKARYLSTRKAAFNNLKKVYKDKYFEEISKCCNKEINPSLKKSMVRFLENKINTDKEQRYEDIYSVKVTPHIKDINLIVINIAGTSYRDLSIAENTLIKDELVFLKREYNNVFDENAIMILNKNGYLLGYVPRNENEILKSLIDNGKIIYGRVLEVSDDYLDIKIKLILSYADVAREVTETFNMVGEKSIGYLN